MKTKIAVLTIIGLMTIFVLTSPVQAQQYDEFTITKEQAMAQPYNYKSISSHRIYGPLVTGDY